jgi:two-component sensor histidine kinase
MSPLKDYPVDVLCTILGGFLLAYAVLKNRLLRIGKTFLRGLLFFIFISGATGIYMLLLFLISKAAGYELSFYSIIPALITFFIIFSLLPKQLTFIGRTLTMRTRTYKQSISDFEDQTRKLQEVPAVFEQLNNALSNLFMLEQIDIHLLDRRADEMNKVYSNPEDKKDHINTGILTNSPLIRTLKNEDILIVDEQSSTEGIDNILFQLKTICGERLPDIVLPLKISEDLIGISMIKFGESAHFLDKEDIIFLLELNKLTSEAVTRAYAFEQMEQEVFKTENLIKDINHRVKNNLQMISGLLALQSLSATNPEVVSALNTAERRIKIIAKIHEMLYIRGVMETVNLKTYIEEVLKGFYTIITENRINIRAEIVDIEVETEKALTICLIVNELVANAVKYAYPADSRGEIRILINKKDDHTINCLISDKGIGCKEAGKEKTAIGIGHNLVNSFIKTQLKGSWEISCENGTEHQILIPLK